MEHFAFANETPAVSVIVPTFQRRQLVQRAVRSVLAQSFGDFEIVVVDDGSTDGTREDFVDTDPRVVYRWQENRGVAAARNAGLERARGSIVAFLDSDNRWLPVHLAVVCGALTRYPEAVLVSTCPRFRMSGPVDLERARVTDLLPELLLRPQLGYISCTAARKQAVDAAGGFDERLSVFEDSDFFCRVAMVGPVCLLPSRTIEQRMTRHGLKQLGRRGGMYLSAMQTSAREAEQRVRQLVRADATEIRRRARAKIELLTALEALAEGDRAAARNALKTACDLVPVLGQEPGVLLSLVRNAAAAPRALLELAAGCAYAWPDPDADTSRYLAAYAALLAFRQRRFALAMTLFTRSRIVARPGLAARTMPLSLYLLRQWRRALWAS